MGTFRVLRFILKFYQKNRNYFGVTMKNLRKAAKGESCQIRSAVCNHNPETTVLCHIHKPSISGGTGLKAHDLLAAWGCSACHDLVDGKRTGKNMMLRPERDLLLYEGILRTQKILIDEGII